MDIITILYYYLLCRGPGWEGCPQLILSFVFPVPLYVRDSWLYSRPIRPLRSLRVLPTSRVVVSAPPSSGLPRLVVRLQLASPPLIVVGWRTRSAAPRSELREACRGQEEFRERDEDKGNGADSHKALYGAFVPLANWLHHLKFRLIRTQNTFYISRRAARANFACKLKAEPRPLKSARRRGSKIRGITNLN